MPNDYEVNVTITEHSTHWAWKIECLGQFVASGTAPLRLPRPADRTAVQQRGWLRVRTAEAHRQTRGARYGTLPVRGQSHYPSMTKLRL